MKTRKKVMFVVYLLGFILFGTFMGTRFSANAGEMTPDEKIQRALDYIEIQKVMAMHTYYYAAQKQREELDAAWSKEKEDIAYGHNNGIFLGRKSVTKYYAEDNENRRKRELETLVKRNPEVKNTEDNLGIGNLVMHPLTTPYIEIAGDGKTAKGVWVTNGLCVDTGSDGKPQPMSFWEKYGVDFVRENGRWKIWHLMIYSDVIAPNYGMDLTDIRFQSGKTAPSAPTGQPAVNEQLSEGEKPQPMNQKSPYDKTIVSYKLYSPTTVPQFKPKLPEPYETWADTTSYVE